MTHKPIYICSSDDPDWLEKRRGTFGASSAAARCNQDSTYSNPTREYMIETGEIDGDDENAIMRYGRFIEPFICNEYEIKTGTKIEQAPAALYRHPEHEWMTATPDGIISWDKKRLIECKSLDPFYARHLGVKSGEPLPKECTRYHFQAQHQMAVMGFDCVEFAILTGRDKIGIFPVVRHEGMIGGLIRIQENLWRKIQDGTPPEWDFEHPATAGVIADLYGDVDDDAGCVELPDHIAEAWERSAECGRESREAEKQQDQYKTEVLAYLGTNAAGVMPDGDKMVKRSKVTRDAYEVEAASYQTTRLVKYDGRAITRDTGGG